MLIKSGLLTNPARQQSKVEAKSALLGWDDFVSWSTYPTGD